MIRLASASLCMIVAVVAFSQRAMGGSVPVPADYAKLEWRAIGPAVQGGRVPAVAGSDSNPFLYYIGTAGSGAYKTTDGGATWTHVFKDKPVAAIGAIAIAPTDPNTVWIGTGEANPRNDVSYGDGVWVSHDGGKHFAHVGLDDTSQISRVLIHPKSPQTVLVGALGDPFADSEARGVYRTTDNGKTWSKTLYVGPSSGVSDLAWSPRRPNVVFAGLWQYRRTPWELVSGGPNGGLYRSQDGGITWTKLTGHGLPNGITGRIGLSVSLSNPNRVYAIIQSKEGVLWRSDDGGNTWRMINADHSLNARPFYFSRLLVDPTNPNHLFTLSLFLSESKDGGLHFKHVGRVLHTDHHAFWWSTDGRRIIDGNDGGVVISLDSGQHWEFRNNLPIGQVYHLGYDLHNPYMVCGAFQDNETFCGPSSSLDPMGILNRHWIALNGGDGMWVWPDPVDSRYIWNDVQDGALSVFDTVSREEVDVSPYPRDEAGQAIAKFAYRFDWDSPIAFLPQDPHTALLGGNVVWKTSDRGRHWQVISPDLTLNEKQHQQLSGGPITNDLSGAEFFDAILDIAPSKVKAGVIWVGTDDGLVQLTRDGGVHWNNVTMSSLPPYGQVETVEASPFDAGAAFAVVDRHLLGDRTPYLFATTDYGQHWTSLAATLPSNQYARTIRQDPRNPDVLYAGLEQGIWISFDRGAHWQSLQLNMPTTSVRDIRIHPVTGDLLVATHGASMFILDDASAIPQLTVAKAAGHYLFQPRDAYRFFAFPVEETGEDNQAPDNYFAGDNPKDGALISFYQSAKSKPAPTALVLDDSGHIIRHISGTHEVEGKQEPYIPDRTGITRFAWDLAVDGPVKWHGTPKWNQGPDQGAEAVPGRYTVRLKLGGTTLERSINVKPDPRETWTFAEYQDRFRYLSGLFERLSAIDVALNRIDALRRELRGVKAPASSPDVRNALDDFHTQMQARFDALTANPQTYEDVYASGPKVREQILGAINELSSSYQPPFAAHNEVWSELEPSYSAAMRGYRELISGALPKLNATMAAAGLKPLR